MQNRIMSTLVASATIGAACLLVPVAASAFCGFYVSGADAEMFNDATMVVMMRDGTRTVLSMQNTYEGPAANFAMVVPVPEVLQEENVRTLPYDVFNRVDQMAAPRLVEYWEADPCAPDPPMMTANGFVGRGAGGMNENSSDDGAGAVRIEAEFEVGEYEIVVLSADDATSLDTWLRANEYQIPDGAEPLFRPYIEQGQYFFVARVNIDRVEFSEDGVALLSPLRFHYDTDTFALPIRLGLINAGEAQDLIVHILGRDQRYEVANYDNVTIPTNINLTSDGLERFSEFYVALFDRTLERNPGSVVTEYAWNASTCDPCPGATLTSADFLSLGADVIPAGNNRSFVLSRLHARYTVATLGEDLVFAAADPIVGGREHNQEDGELEQGATGSDINNFQGRYMVRHPWEGEVTCDEPEFGRWGGPPGTGSDNPQVGLAQGTAFANRGAVQLAAVVAQDVPEIGLVQAAAPGDAPEPVNPGVAAPEQAAPEAGSGSEASQEPSAPTTATTEAPAESSRPGGCSQAATTPATSLLSLAGMMFFIRRRRRARPSEPAV